MKRLLVCMCLLMIGTTAQGVVFPTNSTVSVIDIAVPRPDYTDFSWGWRGWSDQSCKMTFSNKTSAVDLTGMALCWRVQKGNVIYINKAGSDITIADNAITWSVSHTNIPPNGLYKCDVLVYTTTTNLTRSIAQGTLNVMESIYSNTNTTFFPWPEIIYGQITTTNETDPIYVASAASGVTTVKLANWDAASVNGIAATNYMATNIAATSSADIAALKARSNAWNQAAVDATAGTNFISTNTFQSQINGLGTNQANSDATAATNYMGTNTLQAQLTANAATDLGYLKTDGSRYATNELLVLTTNIFHAELNGNLTFATDAAGWIRSGEALFDVDHMVFPTTGAKVGYLTWTNAPKNNIGSTYQVVLKGDCATPGAATISVTWGGNSRSFAVGVMFTNSLAIYCGSTNALVITGTADSQQINLRGASVKHLYKGALAAAEIYGSNVYAGEVTAIKGSIDNLNSTNVNITGNLTYNGHGVSTNEPQWIAASNRVPYLDTGNTFRPYQSFSNGLGAGRVTYSNRTDSIRISGALTPNVGGDAKNNGTYGVEGSNQYVIVVNGTPWYIWYDGCGPDWHLSYHHEMFTEWHTTPSTTNELCSSYIPYGLTVTGTATIAWIIVTNTTYDRVLTATNAAPVAGDAVWFGSTGGFYTAAGITPAQLLSASCAAVAAAATYTLTTSGTVYTVMTNLDAIGLTNAVAQAKTFAQGVSNNAATYADLTATNAYGQATNAATKWVVAQGYGTGGGATDATTNDYVSRITAVSNVLVSGYGTADLTTSNGAVNTATGQAAVAAALLYPTFAQLTSASNAAVNNATNLALGQAFAADTTFSGNRNAAGYGLTNLSTISFNGWSGTNLEEGTIYLWGTGYTYKAFFTNSTLRRTNLEAQF